MFPLPQRLLSCLFIGHTPHPILPQTNTDLKSITIHYFYLLQNFIACILLRLASFAQHNLEVLHISSLLLLTGIPPATPSFKRTFLHNWLSDQKAEASGQFSIKSSISFLCLQLWLNRLGNGFGNVHFPHSLMPFPPPPNTHTFYLPFHFSSM